MKKFKSIFLVISIALIQNAVGQSNYASHANNVGYLGEGLPEEATLDGKVSTYNISRLVSLRWLCLIYDAHV